MAIDFRGAHFPKSVVLYAVYLYLRYLAPIATFKKLWLNVA